MNILEFYRRCESKYEPLSITQFFSKGDVEKILQDAKAGALSQLKILFGKDEKLMFYMLQYLLMIPSSIEIHKNLAKTKRKSSKNISQKKSRFQKKIDQRVKKFISFYRAFNPDVDNKTLANMACNALKVDKSLRLEAELLNDTVENYEEGKTRHGKENIILKDIIYNTFIIAKGKPNNIAKLLNCLNFKPPQGKTYTKDIIKHYCKTTSR